MNACKICGSTASYANPLVLVTVGEIGPDWMCVRDLIQQSGIQEDTGSIR